MPFQPGNPGGGRPKGSQNKEISELRQALTAITVGGLEDFVSTLAELRETNPVKYQETYIKLLEYSLPKLRSVDTNISMDPESLGSIKIEVITKEKQSEGTNNTSN